MKKFPPSDLKPRTCYQDSPGKGVLKPQQRLSYTSPPTSPLDSPEKEGGEMTDFSDDRPLTVAEKVRRLESFSSPGGCDTPEGFDTPGGSDTQDSSKGISRRLMLVKVGEGDSKGPVFNQDPASHTYKRVVAKDNRVTVRDYGHCKEVAVESRTVIMHQTSYKVVSQSPPPLPPFRQTSVSTCREGKQLQRNDNIKADPEFLMEWWKTVISWEDLENQLLKHGEAALFDVKAERICHALLLYEQLLNKNGESLNNNITELFSIADNLDKVSKGTKIAGITGGATSAVGGIAAVAGVVLSPFTFGASLALTAIGVGVATAGGVTGASAAIAHKVSVTQDRKKIETVIKDYRAHVDDLEACLAFINRGVGSLRKHNLAVLTGVHTKAVRVAKVVEVAGDSARAMDASSKASGVLNGFSLGMDLFYSDKDRQKLKKGLESKFAKKLRQVAGQLQDGLKELVKVKDMYKELVKE
ncbi:uncharacterized protein [Osmerus mordax]|uniref:uncharacterized protein n=1 Tax=Osmerus mordax TaxID=8014 RepID=UPI00350F9207